MISLNSTDKCNIVIVDNDATEQNILIDAVRQFVPNAAITSLFDGCDAIDYLFNKTSSTHSDFPDLIFISLEMPKIGGKIITNIIRKQTHLSKVPIVILTWEQCQQKRNELLNLGANAFFIKSSIRLNLKQMVAKEMALS